MHLLYPMLTSFLYGLAFFTLGVAIFLYPRRGSQFKLAEDLGFIALFGMLHGCNEWMEMFKLIHPEEPLAVKIIKIVFLAGSFFFLLTFGTKTITEIKGKNPFARLLPAVLLAVWALLALLSGRFVDGDVFARYILGFPGTLLAAYALFLHVPEITKQKRIEPVRALKVAAAVFIVYGFLAGLIVPGTNFFPASVFNYTVFLEKTGVPVQWFRTFCAIALFFTIIPVLKIFEWETVNSLREARDRLEDRVKERTAALHNANDQLLKSISEIKLAQGALRESEERLVLAQRAGQVGVFDWDIASGKVIWTEQSEKMSGTAKGDFEGDYEDWTKHVHTGDMQRLKVFFREWIESGRDEEHWEYRLFQPDGKLRWIEARGRLISGASNRPVRIIGMGVDVTERKQTAEQIGALNEELKRNVLQLQAANRELEAFTYSVSHDLRAPLRHMAGFVELLNKRAKEGLDEKSRHYLQVISGAASQMGQLVDDLLAFSRAGRVEIKWDMVDSGVIVQEAIANLDGETAGRDIEWKIETLPDVFGDAALLRQVWVNLISNAVKFTRPRQRAIIEIGAQDAGEEKEYLFRIKDNGVGFDMRYKDKLFGLFQRLHREEEFEGTGVGLANVQRIVHRHGGRTWAESLPGEGAIFYFSLPKGRNV